MKNKYKWLEILLFLPPIIFLVSVNLIVDVSQYFHPEISEKIADSILKGQPIRVIGNNGNERKIKQILIEKMNKEIDTIAVGPSLVMYIGSEAVKSNGFLNLGVSGANHYDVMATFGLLKYNEISYKKVIISIDFPIFSNTLYVKNSKRHNDLMPFTNYMINSLEGQIIDFKPSMNYSFKLNDNPAFSLSYFHDCLKFLINQKNLKRLEEVTNKTKEQYYTPEASIFPPEIKDKASEEDVIIAAKKIKTNISQFHDIFNGNIDSECQKQFLQLIYYLQKQNIEIVFWYHPFPPAIWDNTDWNKYPALKELDTWSRNLAKEKNITTVGSYNPHELELLNTDFMDARHLKRSSITQHFKF